MAPGPRRPSSRVVQRVSFRTPDVAIRSSRPFVVYITGRREAKLAEVVEKMDRIAQGKTIP